MGAVIGQLDCWVEFLHLDGDRYRFRVVGLVVQQVHHVLAGRQQAQRDGFLIDGVHDRAPIDHQLVLERAAVVAIQMRKSGVLVVIPDQFAAWVLHDGVYVIRMAVRPAHGNQHLGLRVDLARITWVADQRERDDEHERESEQRVEQQIGERILTLRS